MNIMDKTIIIKIMDEELVVPEFIATAAFKEEDLAQIADPNISGKALNLILKKLDNSFDCIVMEYVGGKVLNSKGILLKEKLSNFYASNGNYEKANQKLLESIKTYQEILEEFYSGQIKPAEDNGYNQ